MQTDAQTVILKSIKSKGWAKMSRYPKCQEKVGADFKAGSYQISFPKGEQEKLEKELKYKEGTLDAFSDFWKSYGYNVGDKDAVLNMNNPNDRLFYYVCMSSSKIANSVTERSDFPKADYVLYDAEQDAKVENLKVKIKKQAAKKYSSMTTEEMRQVLILSGKAAENISEIMVDNQIDKMITDDPKQFLDIVNIDNFKDRVFLKSLENHNIIRKVAGTYFFGDITLGHDFDAATDFMTNPKNQELKMSLKNKLKAKRSV